MSTCTLCWIPTHLTLLHILREKSLAISYNWFSHSDIFSIGSFLLADAQTCQLFENDLMATHKRSKETNSDVIAKI